MKDYPTTTEESHNSVRTMSTIPTSSTAKSDPDLDEAESRIILSAGPGGLGGLGGGGGGGEKKSKASSKTGVEASVVVAAAATALCTINLL